MKNKLQEVTDYKVMSIEEAMTALGFTWEENEDCYNNITCSCGEAVKCSGFIGTERLNCDKCGKEVLDLFSPIQTSNSACTILKSSDFEIEDGNKYWIAIDGNGGIKA